MATVVKVPNRRVIDEKLRHHASVFWRVISFVMVFMAAGVVVGVATFWAMLNEALHDGAPGFWQALFTVTRLSSSVSGQSGLMSAAMGGGQTVAAFCLTDGVLSSVLALCALQHLRSAFAHIERTGRPFDGTVIRRLRLTSRFVIAWAVVPAVASMVAFYFAPPEAHGYGFVTGSLELLLIGIALSMLIKVFEYGCLLQKQDDETL